MTVPSATQASVLAHERGSMLVEGASGTGKTWVLRERFARLIETGADPERVALVAGSKRARRDAREALLARLRSSLPGLKVLTVHGLANHVVGQCYAELGHERPPEILSAADQFARVRVLLEGEDPAEWPAYGRMLRLRGFADAVRQFLTRAQEALRTPDEIAAAAAAKGLSGWNELATFYRRYLDVLNSQGAVDFAGLLSQAAAAADTRDEPLFDHLLVDDYQDTTFAAEALIVGVAAESLVVAGDPQAHVFSFQGTTDEPLRRFTQRIPTATRVELTTDHRRSGGVAVEAWHGAHTSEEHHAVARELRRTHVEQGVPWAEMAVVVRRHGAHVGGLLRALDDAGVPRTVPERGLSLLAEPATFPLVLALRWLARPEERDAEVEALLTSDLVRLPPAQARELVRAARGAGRPAADAFQMSTALDDGPEADSVASAAGALAKAQEVAGTSVLDAFRILWRELPYSRRLVREAETSAEAQRDLDAVVAFADAIARAGEREDRSVAAFLDLLEAGEEGPGFAVGEADGVNAVRVLTAHGTVGREFDTVLVVGAVEGNFPSLTRPEPMFDLAALEGGISQSQRNRLRLEDERRLFRLVSGRARRRVLCTASDTHGDEPGRGTASRFVAEMGCVWQAAPEPPFRAPLTRAEAAAEWRRTLADRTAPAWHRLAALDGLRALGVDPSRWWLRRDWTDTGRPLHEAFQVSASRLEKLENCELEFVLGQELGLGGRSGYQAWVGSLFHRLVDEVEQGTLPRDLEAVRAAARERWRPQEFPSLAVSDAFLRLTLETMLPAWFEDYGVAPALGTEKEFRFEFDGAIVKGFIDRIGPAEGGGAVITDYKTGKSRNAKKAEDNLQLGVYFLAVNHAEELAPFRPVRSVELAFVREKRFRSYEMARTVKAFTGGSQEAYAEAMGERLSELIARLRDLNENELYRPNPAANCRFCEFRQLCSLYPEGRELFPIEALAEEVAVP